MPQDSNVVLEDVEIIFRNFSGREGMYNREGDRNFAIKLNQEMADELAKNDWNVKTLKARDEDEAPQPYLSVSVGYKGRPPTIKLITSRGQTFLDEESVETLDHIDIRQADLIIRPYDWQLKSGASGRKAYLQALYIVVEEDPLALKYGDIATINGPMMQQTGPYVPSDDE